MSDDEAGEQNGKADDAVEAPGYDFKNLTTWQVAMELAAQVYSLTEGFPRHEQYGLVAQMQRAVVSVTSNIAEGHARETKPEYLRGLVLARGSLAELETQLSSRFV